MREEMMRIKRVVFMGTPDFAVPTLKALIDNKYNVCAVFTQPDRPKGRGNKMQSPPVKILAQENGIDVFQPESLRNDDIVDLIASFTPDFIVVVAYGKLLPKSVLDIPSGGCINVHGSLLPKYRGAAPIQHAVINGEKTTGITTMFMSEGLDSGDTILKKWTRIRQDETAGELFDRLKNMGANLLIETLKRLEAGEYKRVVQRKYLATLAPMLKKKDGRIDWSLRAVEIRNKIRGLNPWPCAFTFFRGKSIKIFSVLESDIKGEPGEIVRIDRDWAVCCGENSLVLKEIQPENGKRMDANSFFVGHLPEAGERFE